MKSVSPKQAQLLQILQLGITQYNQGMFQEAYKTFTKAIDFEADADAYHNRGTTCMDLMKIEHAIHDFTAAIIFCPTYAMPYFNRALCMAQILSDNNALSNLSYSDIKEFIKRDLKKSMELGNENARQYLSMIN